MDRLSRPLLMPVTAITLLVAASCAQASPAQANREPKTDTAPADTIGTATEEPDGTIVLNLRATGADGTVGDGQLRYPKTHAHHAMIKAHVGPIPKGGSVAVRPFPDGP